MIAFALVILVLFKKPVIKHTDNFFACFYYHISENNFIEGRFSKAMCTFDGLNIASHWFFQKWAILYFCLFITVNSKCSL